MCMLHMRMGYSIVDMCSCLFISRMVKVRLPFMLLVRMDISQ